MTDVYQKLMAYVTAHDLAYRQIDHDPAGSAQDYNRALGCRLEQQAKCLFLDVRRGDGSHEHMLLTLPAQKRADLKAVARVLDAKKVRLGSRDDLKTVTGCDFGELPPMASLFGLRLVMETGLLDEDKVYLNAGRLDASLVINPHDLERIERPVLITMA